MKQLLLTQQKMKLSTRQLNCNKTKSLDLPPNLEERQYLKGNQNPMGTTSALQNVRRDL